MKCITTEAEKVYRETLHSITLQGEIPTFSGENAKQLKHRFDKEVRRKVQVSTRNTAQAYNYSSKDFRSAPTPRASGRDNYGSKDFGSNRGYSKERIKTRYQRPGRDREQHRRDQGQPGAESRM